MQQETSNLRLQSIYLNSTEFTQFIQKDLCRKWRCHLSVLHVQSFCTLPDPTAWLTMAEAEHVQISLRANSLRTQQENQTFWGFTSYFSSFLSENKNFIQILDNTPVLVTSGTQLKFGLSGSIIMDMGKWPGEKHTKFTVFQVAHKGKIKITSFKVMIHPSLSLNPNIFRISCCSIKITQSVITR